MPNGAHPGRRDEQAPAASGLAPGIQLRAPTLPGPRPCCDAACGVPAGSDERRAPRSIGACRRPKRFAAIRCGFVTFFVPNEKKMRRPALRSEAYVRVCASAVAKGLRWPSGGTRAGANRRGAHASAGGAASTRRGGWSDGANSGRSPAFHTLALAADAVRAGAMEGLRTSVLPANGRALHASALPGPLPFPVRLPLVPWRPPSSMA